MTSGVRKNMDLGTLEELERYVYNVREEFEAYFYDRLKNMLNPLILERVVKGGKRLRPLLLLMFFHALKGKDRKRAFEVACALELAHNASLIHDDIIDMDFERRGRPTLWRLIGINKAALEGYRIMNTAFRIALGEGSDIANIFIRVWDEASRAALKELMNMNSLGKTFYMDVIKGKSASLFEAAAECGAIIAGAPLHTVKLAKNYGRYLGMMYQLADDLLDDAMKQSHSLLNRIREELKRILLSIRFKNLSLLRRQSSRIFLQDFSITEISKYLKSMDKIIEEMGLEEPYKNLLKYFPRYSILSLFKSVKRIQEPYS